MRSGELGEDERGGACGRHPLSAVVFSRAHRQYRNRLNQRCLFHAGPSRAKALPTFSLQIFRISAILCCFPLNSGPKPAARRCRMDQERTPPRRRRLGGPGVLLRRRRIFAWLREGLSYDEIAAEEG